MCIYCICKYILLFILRFKSSFSISHFSWPYTLEFFRELRDLTTCLWIVFGLVVPPRAN